ncbi:GcvT family protein [Kocuria sp.]|uniref:GcvT family protein n=1 Tax=Kocuria sp. TaxID=1871328 RepID=UPI0026E026FE|nr:FAD-dependent oxidoreductase [Kocuria sp.]MDO5618882.1 FAD-dependent oxidoreductase [Kocuria sp.]
MTELQTGADSRVVIIGLGVVGAALADELVLRGWRNVTVVEQGPLYVTGGSSSHAPGFVFQTSPNRTMCQLAQRTLDKLDGLQINGDWVMKRVGGLEIATTEERLQELQRRHGLAQAWGVPSSLVSSQEVAQLWPGLDVSRVLGGFHTPTDAVVKGVRAVEFQARRAQEGGATILANTEVTGLQYDDGRVTGVQVRAVKPAAEQSVSATPEPTPSNTPGSSPSGQPGQDQPEDATTVIPADVVVACAGLWGPKMAREMLGVDIPMLPVEHGFGFSTPVASLADMDAATEVVKPMLRHQDHAMYLREWDNRMAIGAYEHRPLPVADAQIASAQSFAATGTHPAIHEFTREDFDPTWREAQDLLPELRGSQLDEALCFNGIFSFTPDGGPLLGPVPGAPGLWMAQAVWVTQSAGVGQVMAEWITTGDPGIDTHSVELTRFDPAITSQQWAREQGEESYDEVYDIVHPKATTLRMRGLRTSPFHDRQRAAGAQFAVANGWERPLWYQSNQDHGQPMLGDQPLPERDPWAAKHWSPLAAVEAHGLRNSVGLVDMTSLPRLRLSGIGKPGRNATQFLNSLADDGLLSRPVGKTPGSVVYALILNASGGILSDITIARIGPDTYHIGVNGHQDQAWLHGRMRERGADLDLMDVTSGHCGLGLWGPNARRTLEQLVDTDISNEAFRFYRCGQLSIAGVSTLALRLSYVGELGWELYAPAEFGGYLWDQIMAAGEPHNILPVGRRAFESMRLEKGFRLWGADMDRSHTPEAAGLGFAVKGVAAEQMAARGEPEKVLVCLLLHDPSAVVLGHEPVYAAGSEAQGPALGYVTSADQGYTIGQSIAYAWLPAALSATGTEVEIAYFGTRHPATVTAEPLLDPTAERMRS